MAQCRQELEQKYGHDEVDLAINNIDNELGKGFAEMNFDLLEAYVEYLCRLHDSTQNVPRRLHSQ